MSDFALKAAEILLPAVLALVGAALYVGAAYLRQLADGIRNEQARMVVQDLIWRARGAVDDAVRATAQVLVDDLKARRQDGKLTPEDVRAARDAAFAHFKHLMGDAALKELEAVVGDVVTWFNSEVEAAVHRLKAQSPAG